MRLKVNVLVTFYGKPVDTIVHRFLFTGGWVHNATFSHDGEKLAWVGHDSSVSVVNAQTQQ